MTQWVLFHEGMLKLFNKYLLKLLKVQYLQIGQHSLQDVADKKTIMIVVFLLHNGLELLHKVSL
jgi:hypothetical protein